MTERTAKPKGDFLSRIAPIHSEIVRIPGFDGPRPLLSFVLKVLAGKFEAIAGNLAFHLYFDFQLRTPEMERAWQILNQRPKMLEHAVESMILMMRYVTDMWIDSGKSPMDPDVDTPSDRNVEDVLPGRRLSLFQFMNSALFNVVPGHSGMRRDGTQEVRRDTPHFQSDDLENVMLDLKAAREHLGKPGNPDTDFIYALKTALEHYGDRMALHYFAKLLDSPYSRHISRCDCCKTYFAYERARLSALKRGVFCSKCKGFASVKRTEASREARLEALLDTAAVAWTGWRYSRRDPDQREWVAKQVNKACRTDKKRKWVSQNLPEILKRVEALRNAKG